MFKYINGTLQIIRCSIKIRHKKPKTTLERKYISGEQNICHKIVNYEKVLDLREEQF